MRTDPQWPMVDRRQFPLPPGPTELPIVGQAIRYALDPIGLMQDAASYGDLTTMSTKPWLVYLVNHPDLVRDVLVSNHQNVGRWRDPEAFKYLMGEGLVTSDGQLHLRQRRLMQPRFHRRMIEDYSSTMTQSATKHSKAWSDGSRVDMIQEMRDLTLSIATKTIFSIDLPEEVQRIGAAFEASNRYISARYNQYGRVRALLHSLPFRSTMRFKRQLAYLNRVVYGLIEQRQRTGDHKGDLLSLMIEAKNDGQAAPDGGHMTDRQIRDEIVTMLAVGHETVATALTWTWYLLSIHPELQTRFHAELDEVLQGRLPLVSDLPDLTFTEQIVAESMRLYPPIWRIGRVAHRPFELAGYTIPKGGVLCISQVVSHRDPRWFDDPMEFQPDRWTPEFRAKLPQFAYYPFGGGPHVCIGEGFAWMEAKLILALLGQRWRVHPDQAHKVALKPLISLRPKDGMPLFVELRQKELSAKYGDRWRHRGPSKPSHSEDK